MGWPVLIPGLLLGLASSFHCIGMCGPIAFLLPVADKSPVKKAVSILFYNAGRIFTYACIGVIFGVAGRRLYIAGLQQGLSIVLGSVILLTAILLFFYRRIPGSPISPVIFSLTHQLIAKQMLRKGIPAMFSLGAANGLLPCGMVYFALAGALALGTITAGVTYMVAFGVGTMPLMILASYSKAFIGTRWRNGMRKLVPVLVGMMGLLLIIRGCNLDIPYLSPFFRPFSSGVVTCH